MRLNPDGTNSQKKDKKIDESRFSYNFPLKIMLLTCSIKLRNDGVPVGID